MGKFRIEFGFGENFEQVEEWQSIVGLDAVDAETAENVAKMAASTDGLEGALFVVYDLVPNGFGALEIDRNSAKKFYFYD